MSAPLADSAAPPWFAGLNEAQRRAVEHPADAPLLVIAGAGSGKTNTLAHRVAHLIVQGADPQRILLLTFSRRAANEMIRRVERIVATALPGRVCDIAWAGTFHAVGARLLRIHANDIGLDPAFTIHDREDSGDLMNLVRHELGLSAKASRFPTKGTCVAIYSLAMNARRELDEVVARHFPWCAQWSAELTRLFAAYVEAKQRQNVLDYDDLLVYVAEMLADPGYAAEIGGRFDLILVDEYQDTNQLQAHIVQRLKPDGRGVTVVGDDAQSIYSFRAADVRNILDFPLLFGPPAGVVTLEENYRSTLPILTASNAVIGLAAERFTKNLTSQRPSAQKPRLVSVRDEADQVGYVVETVLAAREAGVALKQQAVLFRTAHHSGPLEVELGRRNIPFVKFGGLRFLEAAHIKDVLGVLRFAENPSDRVAGFRVLQLLPGLGPAGAAKILDRIALASVAPALREASVPLAAAHDWPAIVELFARLCGPTRGWPGDLDAVCRWYEPHLQRLYADATVRRADLVQLEQIAAGYPAREVFLTDLTLDPPNATSDRAGPPHLDEDYLILSTIHSAKGQEWTNVLLLNAVDGCLPSDMATGSRAEIEEERRLLYVAMTRAKDALHLIVPQRFYTHNQPKRGDRHVYASRTRFIPPSILGSFECCTWPPARQAAGRAAAAGLRRLDLKSGMLQKWRRR